MTMPTTRRVFLQSVPALVMTPALLAQSTQRLTVTGFNHVTLTVSDLERSIDFYQRLFGFPVQGRQGPATVALRIAAGPAHLGLTSNPSSGNRTPRIDHMCVGIQNFNVDRVLNVLSSHGVQKADERAAMKVQVRMRTPDRGGDPAGTPELYLGDPDGLVMQLQDASYCAGAGVLGNVCSTVEPSPQKGLFAAKGYSHCTVFTSDAPRSNRFYQQLFEMPIQAYQGKTAPILAVGPGVEFLMFSGRAGMAPGQGTAAVHHFCLGIEGFDVNRCIKILESAGIKPRDSQAVGPLRHYISMRMEDRGGAKEGTPELYFTDPDGILVQLQDVSYCGGGGVLGNDCPSL
jgi:catechol 2,3-dioxygenase-like lactoylglutathione lyase family enzyme